MVWILNLLSTPTVCFVVSVTFAHFGSRGEGNWGWREITVLIESDPKISIKLYH